jgi:hypothetical protein
VDSRLDTSSAKLACTESLAQLTRTRSGSTEQREQEGCVEIGAGEVLGLGDGRGEAELVGTDISEARERTKTIKAELEDRSCETAYRWRGTTPSGMQRIERLVSVDMVSTAFAHVKHGMTHVEFLAHPAVLTWG